MNRENKHAAHRGDFGMIFAFCSRYFDAFVCQLFSGTCQFNKIFSYTCYVVRRCFALQHTPDAMSARYFFARGTLQEKPWPEDSLVRA